MSKKHQPKPGRLAFICPNKDHEKEGLAYRQFADPDKAPPECPRHGRMVLQGDKPYFGSAIPVA